MSMYPAPIRLLPSLPSTSRTGINVMMAEASVAVVAEGQFRVK